MMVVLYSSEVLRPLTKYQKFDIPGTYMRACVKDERLDLLDFLPDLKGSFLTIELQNHHHSCRLAYSKCLWTSVFLPIAGGALIYVSMLMYSSGRKQTTNDILILSIFVGLFVGFLTVMIAIFGGARYV
jgi:hypothetical protein